MSSLMFGNLGESVGPGRAFDRSRAFFATCQVGAGSRDTLPGMEGQARPTLVRVLLAMPFSVLPIGVVVVAITGLAYVSLLVALALTAVFAKSPHRRRAARTVLRILIRQQDGA